MKEDQRHFLTLMRQPPARLTAEQTAWVLNCQLHDIPILAAARFLRPLGNPSANAIKFFATFELVEQMKDRTWLAKVTNAVNHHWHKHNIRKQCRTTNGSGNNHPTLMISATVNAG
jgi:hypothetical protein